MPSEVKLDLESEQADMSEARQAAKHAVAALDAKKPAVHEAAAPGADGLHPLHVEWSTQAAPAAAADGAEATSGSVAVWQRSGLKRTAATASIGADPAGEDSDGDLLDVVQAAQAVGRCRRAGRVDSTAAAGGDDDDDEYDVPMAAEQAQMGTTESDTHRDFAPSSSSHVHGDSGSVAGGDDDVHDDAPGAAAAAAQPPPRKRRRRGLNAADIFRRAAEESDRAAWSAQLARLVAYKARHGNCNVSTASKSASKVSRYQDEQGTFVAWVRTQRKCKQALDAGATHPGITAERVAQLDALGFVWTYSSPSVWDEQLAALATYATAHGDCNVPKDWADDPKLGKWVRNQVAYKRRLDRGEPNANITSIQVAKLDALGFAWSVSAWKDLPSNQLANWEAQLERLAAYKAEHGDCSVPMRWAEDPRLGRWVNNQRNLKRKLDRGEPSDGMTVERAARLTALGLVWEGAKAHSNEADWEAQLRRLAAYKVKHGDCNVSQGWAEDPRLGRWVSTQREGKRKLDRGEPRPGITVERAARLTALGLVWEGAKAHPNEADWEAQLARLAAYKVTHGDCNASQGWAEDPRLGRWVSTQRWCKKKLDRGEPRPGITVERAARLKALGRVWEGAKAHTNEADWEAQLSRLAAYKVTHGDCNASQGWAEDPRLGRGVSTQRWCKKKLDRGEPRPGITVERVAKLDALGFAWSVGACESQTTAGWEAHLARLAAYKAEHGDCNVPRGWAEDPRLGTWVNSQRKYKKALDRGEPIPGITVERAAKLDALGFVWAHKLKHSHWASGRWEDHFAELAAYKARHGHCNVPSLHRSKGSETAPDVDLKLSSWVGTQRTNKKKLDGGDAGPGITVARVTKLEALGFCWKLNK
jgi:hypothetical protein